jgi:signal transduction histidine kinase
VALTRCKLALKGLFFMLLTAGLFIMPQRGDMAHFPSAAQDSIPGVLDLSDWSFQQDGIAKLNGNWAFYWQKLHTPDTFAGFVAPVPDGFFYLPGSWNHYGLERNEASGIGYGTYRLKVKLPQEDQTYALRIPLITSAYKLWINGEEVASVGETASRSADSVPRYQTKTIAFHTDTSEIDILLQVANFFHSKGGIRQPIEMGYFEQIKARSELSVGFDMLLFGSLMIMGLYHLGFFALRRKESSTLYFGVFCVIIAIRTVLIGDIVLLKLFPWISWEVELKLEYLSVYGALCVFMLFIGKMYSSISHILILRSFTILCGAYTLLTLCTSALTYTRLLFSFHILTALGISYIFYVLLLAWRRKQEGSFILLIASSLLSLTLINDILYVNEWIDTMDRAAGLGLLIFIVSQSMVLSMKISRAFLNEEKMSAALAEMNTGLNAKIRDRTADLEWAHDKLLLKNNELSRLETSRSHLLSNISHDLGTPLTTIQCYLEAILDGLVETDEQREQHIRLIHEKVLGMERLIDDLFQLSRLEARQVEFKRQGITTDRLIYLLFTRYELDAQNAGLSYELTIRGSEDRNMPYGQVHVDLERLHQVFSNLIYNAIKFTPMGGNIRVEMVDDDSGEMLCRIADNGSGIRAEDIPYIFDRFYTSSSSRSSVSGGRGVGLGLSISKEIIESHGGRIWVEHSDIQVGTVFCFTIPIQSP